MVMRETEIEFLTDHTCVMESVFLFKSLRQHILASEGGVPQLFEKQIPGL